MRQHGFGSRFVGGPRGGQAMEQCHQFGRAEWLGHEAIGAGLERALLIGVIDVAGHGDDPRVLQRTFLANGGADLESVHPRQQQITNDRRRPVLSRQVDARLAIARFPNLPAVVPEIGRHHAAHDLIIVDQNNRFHAGTTSPDRAFPGRGTIALAPGTPRR